MHLNSFYICSSITECNCFMGKLYVVPTPVGNLEDMTFRAIRVLKEADLILAEDTRTSGILLKHFEIKNAMQSHHKFNEHKTVEGIVNRIKAGETVALISDAGTPGISDPGFLIVRECVKSGIEVQCLPGATAFVCALIASGISPQPFLFYGFLNSKDSKRRDELEMLKDNEYTMIFYEAPHRIMKTLNMMLEVFGDRDISISREITKKFETVYRGKLSDVIRNVPEKGEFVIVVSGCEEKFIDDNLSIKEAANLYIKAGLDVMTAIKKVAKDRKIPKNEVYKEYHKEEK